MSATDSVVCIGNDDAALHESLKNRGEGMIDNTVLK